jgi:hypothetical protein
MTHPSSLPPLIPPEVKHPAGASHTYKDNWRAKDLELFRAVIAQENDVMLFFAADIHDVVANRRTGPAATSTPSPNAADPA